MLLKKEKNESLIYYGIVGLLTGLGTVLGSGCTSGHMICGVSRFSVRSIVATGVFFTTAVLTENILKRGNTVVPQWYIPPQNVILIYGEIFIAVVAIYELIKLLQRREIISKSTAELLNATYSGFVFGCGLGFSGMTKASKLLGFFDFFGNWDPSLIAVCVSALLSNTILYHVEIKQLIQQVNNKPYYGSTWNLPTTKSIDRDLIIGAALFGFGWGFYGMCPGPIVFNLIKFDVPIITTMSTVTMGMFIGNKLKELINI